MLLTLSAVPRLKLHARTHYLHLTLTSSCTLFKFQRSLHFSFTIKRNDHFAILHLTMTFNLRNFCLALQVSDISLIVFLLISSIVLATTYGLNYPLPLSAR